MEKACPLIFTLVAQDDLHYLLDEGDDFVTFATVFRRLDKPFAFTGGDVDDGIDCGLRNRSLLNSCLIIHCSFLYCSQRLALIWLSVARTVFLRIARISFTPLSSGHVSHGSLLKRAVCSEYVE